MAKIPVWARLNRYEQELYQVYMKRAKEDRQNNDAKAANVIGRSVDHKGKSSEIIRKDEKWLKKIKSFISV